jgi:hypothetical protein
VARPVVVDAVVAQVKGLQFAEGGLAEVEAAVAGDLVVVCLAAQLPRYSIKRVLKYAPRKYLRWSQRMSLWPDWGGKY